jgi:hypothetical protein
VSTSTNSVRAAVVIGPLLAIGVAWVTSSVSEDMGIANVALVLAIISTVAALVHGLAGLTTSIAAALSLNYFHTEPVHTLRITAGSDLLAVALLATLGLIVSAVTALRVRRNVVVQRVDAANVAAARLMTELASGRPVSEVWDVTVAAMSGQFGLVDARLEPVESARPRPVVSRQPWEPGSSIDHSVVLPEGGAVVHFRDPRHPQQLVLTPRAGMGAITVDRRVALTLADQIEVSLGDVDPQRLAAS